ncbi:hypothetical protein [Marinomonas shanghaiensis]|uniref:hypothetical protein n=1 Tax=Marinomonas shanghaiensis TaxID=2202418 RepID=UPI000DB9FA92|nr:hypothetical protein [Marinomonas shanghaiensis]
MRVRKVMIIGVGIAVAAVAAMASLAGFDAVSASGLLAISDGWLGLTVGKSPMALGLLVFAIGVLCSLVFYRRLLLGSLLFFFSFAAYAAEVVAVDDGGLIAMIFGALPALIELLPAWVGVLVGVLYAVAHLVATLPAKFTANWPSWLKSLINLMAANYGKAKNKDG